MQIGESITALGKHTKLKHTVIFGGVSQFHQVNDLRRGVDIVVATPGRLLDLMNQGLISLARLQILVFDEADRMLDMGFIHDIKRILTRVPSERQTLFFSATMPTEIQSPGVFDTAEPSACRSYAGVVHFRECEPGGVIMWRSLIRRHCFST